VYSPIRFTRPGAKKARLAIARRYRAPVPIRERKRAVAVSRVADTARALLDTTTLCAIATVSARHGAHVNTAYFAWSPAFEIVWLSDPAAEHSRNLRGNSSTAVAVYDSRQVWDRPDRGIQLFGSAARVSGRAANEAKDLYTERFPEAEKADLDAYAFYRFRPRRLKLFDEPAFGAGVFVTAAVGRGGRLMWKRTEVYEP
jgi:uncharacterized protein YhbP (UPF0306 family)